MPEDALTKDEREKYEAVWRHREYRGYSPAMKWAPFFAWHILRGASVNDYGCGCGRVANFLQSSGCTVTAIDFADNCLDDGVRGRVKFVRACLWDMPDVGPADVGLCCDVMEHIPPDKVDAVLQAISGRTARTLFSIATKPDRLGPKLVNRPLHLSVHDAAWWFARLSLYWEKVVELAHTDDEILVMCDQPRQKENPC